MIFAYKYVCNSWLSDNSSFLNGNVKNKRVEFTMFVGSGLNIFANVSVPM